MRDGELVGIVSRRDVERAERAGRLDLPVSSHMSQDLETIERGVVLFSPVGAN